MTNQEAYDKIYKAAHDGTFPSTGFNSDGIVVCVYRADRTAECATRCVAGLFMPDSNYKEVFDKEQLGAGSLFYKGVFDIPEEWTETDLEDLQTYHDDIAKLEGGWKAKDFMKLVNEHRVFDDVEKIYF